MERVNSAYRPVLARKGCARLLSSALLARLPQGMSSLAILLLVKDATGSYAAAGVAVGVNALMAAVFMPVQGRLVDRFGIRQVILPASVAQGVSYCLLGLLGRGSAGAVVLISAAALVGAMQPPVAPVVRATLRTLFDDHKLRETAFALEAVLQEIIWVSGPLLITLLITLSSPDTAIFVIGAIGLFGGLVFLTSPTLTDSHEPHGGAGGRGSALRSADLRWLLLPVACMGFGLGCLDVGIPSIALHLGSRPASGVLLAIWSFGSITGGLIYGTLKLRRPVGSRYAQLLALNVLFLAPYLFADSIPVCALASLSAGLAIAPAFSCQYSLAGRVIRPGTEHESFSWILSALVTGAAAGSALSGVAIGAAGIRGPFMLAFCSAIAGALASARFRGRFPNDPGVAAPDRAAAAMVTAAGLAGPAAD